MKFFEAPAGYRQVLLNWKLIFYHKFLLKDPIVFALYFYKKQQIWFRQYKWKGLLKLMLCRFYPSLPDKKMIAFTFFFFTFFFSEMCSQIRVFLHCFRIKIDLCFLLFFQLSMLITYVFRIINVRQTKYKDNSHN